MSLTATLRPVRCAAALAASLLLAMPLQAGAQDRALRRAAPSPQPAQQQEDTAPQRILVKEGTGEEAMLIDIQVLPERGGAGAQRPPPGGEWQRSPSEQQVLPEQQAPSEQQAVEEVPPELIPRAELPAPTSGRAQCFQQAREGQRLSDVDARWLCDASESDGPVRCYALARERGLLEDEKALRLCQYAESEAPARCLIEAKLRTFLASHELVQLCQPAVLLPLGSRAVYPTPAP